MMKILYYAIGIFLLFCGMTLSASAQQENTQMQPPAAEAEGWGNEEGELKDSKVKENAAAEGWGDATDVKESAKEEGKGEETEAERSANAGASGEGEEPATAPKMQLPFHGFLRTTIAHHTSDEAEPKGFSSAQVALELEYDQSFLKDYRFHFVGQIFHDFVYEIEGRDLYSSEELDEFEDGGEVKELWFSYRGEAFNLSLGRQIVVWGEADGLAVTDLINPRDQSLLFFKSLEDSRLSVGMTRLNYYWGENTLSFIVISEFRPNRMPPPGSEFDFRPALLQAFSQFPFGVEIGNHLAPEYDEKTRETLETDAVNSLKTPEWGIRLVMPGTGYDISFMAASLFDDDFVFQVGDTTFSSGFLNKMKLDLVHERFNMFGMTFNKLIDAFVFKAEVAYYQDKSYNVLNQGLFTQIDPSTMAPSFLMNPNLAETLFLIKKQNVVNTAIGFDYTYSDQLSVLFQQQYQQILEYENDLLAEEEVSITFVNFAFSFMNDQLKPGYAVFYIGEDDDYLHKAKITYETTMGINVSFGVDLIVPSDEESRVGQFREASRLWTEIKYSF
ncbi:DUF1302 family protein [Deltaproteobacteria bacterium TL4]